jgi:hypothetical protein
MEVSMHATVRGKIDQFPSTHEVLEEAAGLRLWHVNGCLIPVEAGHPLETLGLEPLEGDFFREEEGVESVPDPRVTETGVDPVPEPSSITSWSCSKAALA